MVEAMTICRVALDLSPWETYEVGELPAQEKTRLAAGYFLN